jgi:hypothetical protein
MVFLPFFIMIWWVFFDRILIETHCQGCHSLSLWPCVVSRRYFLAETSMVVLFLQTWTVHPSFL